MTQERNADRIYPGQNVSIDVEIRDPYTKELIDPGSLSVVAKAPDGAETVLTVARRSQGFYQANVVPNSPGRWKWRAYGTPPGRVAQEGWFEVQKSSFESV